MVNQKEVLSILVIMFFVSSILSVFSLFYVVNKTTISGKATSAQGTVSLTIEEPEAPPPSPTPTLGGGGPSGGGLEEGKAKIIVDKEEIKLTVKQNELTKERIQITNIGQKSTSVTITIDSIAGILSISDRSFTISPGETKVIVLNILSPEAGVFTGLLKIETPQEIKIIPVTIEVESKEVLFDLSIDLNPKSLFPNEKLTVQATLFNLYEAGLLDVNIGYSIKDFNNNILLDDTDVVTIQNQATFSKVFTIPPNAEPGEYVLITQAKYAESVGTASESFTVKKLEVPEKFNYLFFVFVLIILILIILTILLLHKKRKATKNMYSNVQKQKEKQVKKLIKHYLRHGFSKENIKSELRRNSWPEKIIEKLVK